MPKVIAYQVADSIDIKTLKADFKSTLIYSDAEELFYETGPQTYFYIFRYGVVSFFSYEEIEISSLLQFIKPYCRNYFTESINDELIVEPGAVENKISYNKIEIKEVNREVLRMIMLNVSQSVTLDYYSELTSKLLEETNHHTMLLAKKGRLSISGIHLKKYIGNTLLLKNRIAENLFIFDSPPETWEDEQLDKLHNGLKKNFDLQDRFRSVSEGLGIVKENLDLFKDILQYRKSITLEWVVIALIAVEVINFFVDKFFR
jgi:required for meiotic nuclear division protein 1